MRFRAAYWDRRLLMHLRGLTRLVANERESSRMTVEEARAFISQELGLHDPESVVRFVSGDLREQRVQSLLADDEADANRLSA